MRTYAQIQTNSQVLREREREEGEDKKQGTAKYWDPVAKRAVTLHAGI